MGVRPVDLGLPQQEWRPGQWDVLCGMLSEQRRFTLLQAPTGVGKSVIAAAYGELVGAERIVILCSTKQLQAQYRAEFGYPVAMGRNNFDCHVADKRADAADCVVGLPCPLRVSPPCPAHSSSTASCPECMRILPECDYYRQLAEASRAKVAVLNYSLWLNMVGLGYFKDRDLVIADEAHLIENEIRSYASVEIKRSTITRLFGPQMWPAQAGTDAGAWLKFCSLLRKHAWNELGRGRLDTPTKILRDKLRAGIDWLLREADPEKWVVVDERGGVTIKPVWVQSIANDVMFQHAKHWMLMSATILDPVLFTEQLGIDPEEALWVQAPSQFKRMNRPLYYWPAGTISNKNQAAVAQAVEHVKHILTQHPDERGLIHTNSYKLAQSIMDGVQNPRLMTHDAKTRMAQLTKFQATPGAVLVSPSLTTGVDLPYDACRFQIVVKIPFPDKSDPQIMRRMKEGPDGQPNPKGSEWYDWLALCGLIQAYGRGMRAADDSCVSYLLDGNWRWFRSRVRHMIPDWFREAIIPYQGAPAEPTPDEYLAKIRAEYGV